MRIPKITVSSKKNKGEKFISNRLMSFFEPEQYIESKNYHRILLLGYDDIEHHLILLNSYGKQIGSRGYHYISYKDILTSGYYDYFYYGNFVFLLSIKFNEEYYSLRTKELSNYLKEMKDNIILNN